MQQKTNQIKFRIKKVVKKKGDKLYIYILRGKVMLIRLIAG